MDKKNNILKKVTNEFNKVTSNYDWYVKNHVGYIELDGGYIYYTDKPRIETRFCFGYGSYLYATDEQESNANKLAKKASTFEYFQKENISQIQSKIDKLKDTNYKHFLFANYVKKDCVMVTVSSCKFCDVEWYFNNCKDCVIRELTKKDKQQIVASLEIEKEKLSKRINTYWKKYGSSKLNIWTYLVD